GLRFGAHPHRAQLCRRNAGARQRVARGLDAHRRRVLVGPRHSFLTDGQRVLVALPDARDLLSANAEARHVGAVACDSNVSVRPHDTHQHLTAVVVAPSAVQSGLAPYGFAPPAWLLQSTATLHSSTR